MIRDLQNIFANLIYCRHSIHMLHWRCVGTDFDSVHSMLDGYVSKMSEFIDEVAEMILSLDGLPLTFEECVSNDSIQRVMFVEPNKTYTNKEVYKQICNIFTELYRIYSEATVKCNIGDCASKLDEHRYWLRIEGGYKNKNRML